MQGSSKPLMVRVRFPHGRPNNMKRANLLEINTQRIFVCDDTEDTEFNEKGETCYKARYYGRDSLLLKPIHTVEVIEIANILS